MAQRGRTSKNADSGTKSKSRAKTSARTNMKNAAKNHTKDRVADAMSDEDARATLEASDKLYYRIGEVSELTAVKAHVLRYWETEFRWMAPPKSRSKQRLYRKRDIQFVWLLKRLLWDERYTIAGARQRIQELGVDEALKILDLPIGQTVAGAAATVSGSIDFSAFIASIGEARSELMSLREELATPA
jgi:DNA-binding transcriptional MerR regulator